MGSPDISTAGHTPQQSLKDLCNLPRLSYKKWPGSKQGDKEALKNNENHTEFC